MVSIHVIVGNSFMCKRCFKAPPKGKNVFSMDPSDITARAKNDVAVNYFSSDVIGVSVERRYATVLIVIVTATVMIIAVNNCCSFY